MSSKIFTLLQPKLIEFVCTANHGRSPVAELIAQAHLKRLGLDTQFRAVSSGSSARDIAEKMVPESVKRKYVVLAKERGDIYSAVALTSYADAMSDNHNGSFDWFYESAIKQFEKEEHEWRAEAIEEFGIEGVLKEQRDQTIVRPDAAAVLTMAPSNNRQVRALYSAQGYSEDGHFYMERPDHTLVVAVLPQYARNDLTAENPDAFGRTKELYFQNVEAFMQDVPKAIERILNELSE